MTRPDRAAKSLSFLPKEGPRGDVLVSIFLRGGLDGIHAVPPYAEPEYQRLRPEFARAELGRPGGPIDLDGHFGFHPRLSQLSGLFHEKRLAVVHACGSGDQTLSHFAAMNTMESGVADEHAKVASGWLARHLAAHDNGNASPLRSIAIGELLPKALQGGTQSLAIRSLNEFSLNLPRPWNASFPQVLEEMYESADNPVGRAGRTTLALMSALQQLAASGYRPANNARYPEDQLGGSLKQVAQLIKAELGLETAVLEKLGWDTHTNQLPRLDRLLGELSAALIAFCDDLGDRMQNVTIVVMSEFGRRIKPNLGGGTDHGRGTVMLVIGGGTRGGKVYGQWPGLASDRLDLNGNLQVTTDYRSVLAEVLCRRLGQTDPQIVFPNCKPKFLDIVDARS